MPKSFYELDIWKEGYTLLLKIYKIANNFPSEEKYILTPQLIRSANSIIANIAESQGRYYFKDKIRTLYTARGEVEEVRSHLRVAAGREYITKEEFSKLDKEYEKLSKRISAYIKSIRIH